MSGLLRALFACMCGFGLMLAAAAQGAEPATRDLQRVGAAPSSQPADLSRLARLALVIGNADYEHGKLRNPVNDARDMAAELQRQGFEVLAGYDLDRSGMRELIREFDQRLQRTTGVGFFFYAGHGAQYHGKDFLVPLGADIQSEDEIEDEAIAADFVLEKMEATGNRLNVIVLDACRNNPFPRSFTRSGAVGLAGMDASSTAVGTFIAYATGKGMVAQDGEGRNGLFTQHMLEAMRVPGIKLEDVFKRVISGVSQSSRGRQIPWQSSSVTGDFYFSGAPTGAAGSPDPAPLPALPQPVAPAPTLPWIPVTVGGLALLVAGAAFIVQRRRHAYGAPGGGSVQTEAPPVPALQTGPVRPAPLTRQNLGPVYHAAALAYLCDANTHHVFGPLCAGKPFTVGRSSKCTVQLHDERISTRHLALGWDVARNAPWIEDLDSSNGVFTGAGERIAAGTQRPVAFDEVFWLAHRELAFVLRRPADG